MSDNITQTLDGQYIISKDQYELFVKFLQQKERKKLLDKEAQMRWRDKNKDTYNHYMADFMKKRRLKTSNDDSI